MLNPFRTLTVMLRRGALVLALACLFVTCASARAASLVTGMRATTEDGITRIAVAGSVPLAYGVRQTDAHTLLVELPGADATHLAASYQLASPLASAVHVECVNGTDGAPLARLNVALLAPVRERAFLSGNELVLELAPEAGAGVQPQAVLSEMNAGVPQQQPTPVQPRTPTAAQSDQGKHYGEYGFVGEPINLNVVNADIRDILNYITEQYAVNFIIDKSVGAVPVTVNVTDVPWNYALDAILRANRLGIVVEGNILRVATVETLALEAEAQAKIQEGRLNAAQLVTEFIRLNYARASGTLASAAGQTAAFGGGQSSGATSQNSVAGNTGGGFGSNTQTQNEGSDLGILPIIQRRLSRRGSVEVDGRSNTLIVTDVRENIEAIRQLVALLDQPEPQVEIETRIVIANRNFSRDLGVQLSAGVANLSRGGLGNINTLPASGSSGTGGSSTTTPLTSGPNPFGVFGGLAGTTQPTSSLGATAASTVIGLTTGLIGTAQISLALTAAESKGQAKIVATPRVTALNNRSAQIESGQQIPVVTPQTGANGSGNTVFTTTFISVPLRLSVTPQITDAGTVILHVVAENNSVNLSLSNSLGTPGIDTQRMQTEVLVPDGGTTVVGGVLADNEGETQSRTPGLSGIPVLGNLFKRRATTRTTNELLFFITPRIYRPDYNGRPTNSTVTDRTRTITIPQPVPLGNPQTNTPVSTQPYTTPTTVPTVVVPTQTAPPPTQQHQ